jgi:nicotinamide-nucleotide amidase
MDAPRLMQAEVLAIGDELVSGQRLDTNSQWLSARLAELGIATLKHTTVGDDLTTNVDAFRLAAQRSDIVVATGGLGPTLDDLTRQALAQAFDAPLELDVDSLRHIQQLFAQRTREMPERNRSQALFPRGSRIVPNPFGTAPGIDLTVTQGPRPCRIFALPGVPAEMKQMWTDSVAPRIEQVLGQSQGSLQQRVIKLFGIGESDVEVRLPDLIQRGRTPTVGITVSQATITLRIAARAHSESQFSELVAPTIAQIDQALGELIFGSGDDELEHAVLRQLASHHLSLASVEIGAASWVSDWMLQAASALPAMDKPGRPDVLGSVYKGGLAFPTLEMAGQWFSGEAAPGEALWPALAKQARQRFAADIALVVGCYPNRTQIERSAVPFDFTFAIATDTEVIIEERKMGGHPEVLGPRAAKTGLDILRRRLAAQSDPSQRNRRLGV